MQSFSIIQPSPTLKPYIRHYWILQDDSAATVSERILPTGCIQMVFHKGNPLFSLKRKNSSPDISLADRQWDSPTSGLLD